MLSSMRREGQPCGLDAFLEVGTEDLEQILFLHPPRDIDRAGAGACVDDRRHLGAGREQRLHRVPGAYIAVWRWRCAASSPTRTLARPRPSMRAAFIAFW